MSPDPQALLALILRRSPQAPARTPPTRTLPTQWQADPRPSDADTAPPGRSPRLDASLRAVQRLLPALSEAELDDYFWYALLGVAVGLDDRNLSPLLPEHQAIVPPLLEEIRAVYGQVRASGAAYSPEEFAFRAFDYGIHKAYYLDWQLYLSRELY